MYEIKYRTEDEMKDSGIEWLGMIPRDWEVSKIKYNTYVKGRIGWQGLRSDEFIDSGPFLVTGTDFINGRVEWNTCYHISGKRYKEAPAIHLKNGDLLITKDGSIGKLAIVKDCPNKAILNSGIFLTRCLNDIYITKYMFYILYSQLFNVYIDLTSTGSTIKHLYQETFINFSFPLPEIRKQQKITDFLNIKTAEFDSIISKKELLIEKLEEAKKSLISEVVTGKVKIVNGELVERKPDEMKDSGIEWLGMIPKDWEKAKFKRYIKINSGREILDESKDIEKPINVYGSGGVFKKTSNVLYGGEAVLFGRKGTIGKPLYVNEEFWTVDTMYYCNCNKEFLPRVLYYQLLVVPWNLMSTQTALPSIVGIDVGNLSTVIPRLKEQNEIMNFLNIKTKNIDSIITKTKLQIEKLKEAKQSLISEAVTGKIDLRDWEIEEI